MYHDARMHPISCKGVATTGRPVTSLSSFLCGVTKIRNHVNLCPPLKISIVPDGGDSTINFGGEDVSAKFKKCGRSCPTIFKREQHKSGDRRLLALVHWPAPQYGTPAVAAPGERGGTREPPKSYQQIA